MILSLDIGNSQIYGAVFEGAEVTLQFRKSSKHGTTSDELGLFFRSVLRENGLRPESISSVALCSVVPDLIHSVRACCVKYFNLPPFILQAGVKTGLKIRYKNPLEVGADRIANAIGALQMFPGKNLVIVDFGTATTYCAVSKDRDYLGGLIVPGIRLAMESLESGTAKLPIVEIVIPDTCVGRSTVESIQAGLYFGNLAMVKELSAKIKEEHFKNEPTLVIGTGGFSKLFERQKIFDAIIPELVHIGLCRAVQFSL